MQLKDLRPAHDFAMRFGAKCMIYGPPGTGKTPIVNSAPRPVLLACEPGLLSMRGSKVPTWPGLTAKAIDEFFTWLFNSAEAKNFDTVAVDSTSQMAEIYLKEAEKSNKHGLAAYGEMSRKTMEQLGGLYFMENKHTYLIAKQEIISENGISIRRPYFPGKEIPVKLPHMYDGILHLDFHNVPGVGTVKSFRCIGSIDTTARNRTGTLAEFEQPDFGQIVQKMMQ